MAGGVKESVTRECLSTAFTCHPLIALVPLVFGHCPCLCCFLCSFHGQGHQDAHVWFCFLLSSLKLILLLLSISSNIHPTHQEAVATPLSSAIFRHCLAGQVRSWTNRPHVPYPPWSSGPFLVSLCLGFKASNSNVKRLLSDKASHLCDEISHIPSKCYYHCYNFLADIYSKGYWVSTLFSVPFVKVALPLWWLSRTNVTFIPGLRVRPIADSLPSWAVLLPEGIKL